MHYSPRHFAAVSAAGFVLVTGAPAIAQSTSNPLPSREQIEVPGAVAPVPATQVAVEDARPTTQCPFDGEGLTARIDTVTFTGSAGETLPAEITELLSTVRPAGGEERLTQICALRDEAAARLGAAGYIAAVTIPSQEINRDVRAIRLEVVLARIVSVSVEGDAGSYAGQVNALSARLRDQYPLKTAYVERALLLTSDSPGLNVQMTLVAAASGVPGELEGKLRVARRPFALSAVLQNYGSKVLGRESATVRAEFYGLTGLSDTTFLGATSTLDFNEQWSVQGGHYLTTPGGLTLGGSLAYGEAHPDLALDIRTNSLLGVAEAYMPIVRTVSTRTTIGGGIEIVDQESTLHGGGLTLPLTRDKLRIGFLKLQDSYRQLAPNGAEIASIDASLQLRKGLDIFGASERGVTNGGFAPSKLEGNPTAFLVRGGYSARIRSGNFMLSSRVDGQFSDEPLLSFEEYSVGNYTLGRGYDPAVAAGDSALGGRLQPSMVLAAGSVVLEPYGFVDAVRVWNRDRLATSGGRSLVSAGLGARAYFANQFALDAGWAHPFDSAIPGGHRAPDRFLISLSAALGPQFR